MTPTNNKLTSLLHAILVLAVLFLAVELYQLRIAVELSNMASPTETIENQQASLQRPLGDLARRMETIDATLQRSTPPRPRAPASETRIPIPQKRPDSDLAKRLEAIISTLERLDKSFHVRIASLPPRGKVVWKRAARYAGQVNRY